jgi:hypothetical protein
MVRSGVEKKQDSRSHHPLVSYSCIIASSSAASVPSIDLWAKLLEYIIMNSHNNQVNVLDFQEDLPVEEDRQEEFIAAS